MIGVGKDYIIQDPDCPTKVTLVERLLCLGYDLVCDAEQVDVALGPLRDYILPQLRGVAVEPAYIALVDGLNVMANGAVVAARVLDILDGQWHSHLLSNLGAIESLIQQTERLVIHVHVEVALRSGGSR